MEQVRYQQLGNFLRQRAQKIPGLPFLSLWQFGGAVAFGFAGRLFDLPGSLTAALALVALVLFYVYNGEFAGRRLLAIAAVSLLALFGRPRTVSFDPAWQQLAEDERPSATPATITLEGEVGRTVLS